MKKLLVLYFFLFSGIAMPLALQGQSQEAVQLVLNYEKLLQLEEILDNMYKGYKILSDGYNTIKNIAEGNFNIHQAFLSGLYAVNPSVKNYVRVAKIVEYQQLLVQRYKKAWKTLSGNPYLTETEINHIEKVYSGLVEESLRSLDELLMVVTASKLRMSDEERLKAIDRIYYQVEDELMFLTDFNNSTQVLLLQRQADAYDADNTRKLYSVTP
jgi:hypothetical protein